MKLAGGCAVHVGARGYDAAGTGWRRFIQRDGVLVSLSHSEEWPQKGAKERKVGVSFSRVFSLFGGHGFVRKIFEPDDPEVVPSAKDGARRMEGGERTRALQGESGECAIVG
jgi:hypothetical protein